MSEEPASRQGERKAWLPERPKGWCSADGMTWARWIYCVYGGVGGFALCDLNQLRHNQRVQLRSFVERA